MTSVGGFQEHVREENQEGPQRQLLSCFLGEAPQPPRPPGSQTAFPVCHHSKQPIPLSGICQNELQNSRILESTQGYLNHKEETLETEWREEHRRVNAWVRIGSKSSQDQILQRDTEELAERVGAPSPRG